MDLVETVRELTPLHTDRVIPVRRRIRVATNGKMLATGSMRIMKMGRFYEELTAGMYGGVLEDTKETYDGGLMKPDVVDHKNKVMTEAKGVRIDQKCDLLDPQVEHYMDCQRADPELRIYMAIYRHILPGIVKTWRGTSAQLYRQLAKQTICSTVMPLSLMLALHTTGNSNLIYRYDGEGRYGPCTCIRPRTLRRLFEEPEKVIEELGLKPEEFILLRRISPKVISVNGTKVQEFPVMIISDKYHRKWVREFIKKCTADVPF